MTILEKPSVLDDSSTQSSTTDDWRGETPRLMTRYSAVSVFRTLRPRSYNGDLARRDVPG